MGWFCLLKIGNIPVFIVTCSVVFTILTGGVLLWFLILLLVWNKLRVSINSFWVSCLNPTYKLGDRTDLNSFIKNPDSGVSQTFSINEIESLTGLDFFSEIPDEFEEQLESRDDSNRINSANLLASSFIDRGSFDIDSIGQSNFPEESLFISETSSDINFREVNQKNSGKFEIDIAEISPVNSTLAHSNTVHVRPSKVGTEITTSQHIRSSQIGRAQARQPQTTSSQHSTDSDNLIQISLPQTSVTQNSTTQVGTTQISTAEISPMQIGTTKIDSFKVSTSKIDSTTSTFDVAGKFDSGEISFSSSIPAQQLINSHFNHTDDSSFTKIYSTAQTLWNIATQLDINFQITDLPKGQLAEATITGFDSSGVPNAGTIFIDKTLLNDSASNLDFGGQIIYPETLFDDLSSLPTLRKRDRS
jgi:hypothetical protein